jgi:hypothetical protein
MKTISRCGMWDSLFVGNCARLIGLFEVAVQAQSWQELPKEGGKHENQDRSCVHMDDADAAFVTGSASPGRVVALSPDDSP